VNIPADDPRAVTVVAVIQSGDVEGLRRMLSESPGLATASCSS
jgi:hypothetical protein